MTSEATVTYYWRLTVEGHLRFAYVKDKTLDGAKAKGGKIGTVTGVERLMPVKKGRAKGYSFPTTFWREEGKVTGV